MFTLGPLCVPRSQGGPLSFSEPSGSQKPLLPHSKATTRYGPFYFLSISNPFVPSPYLSPGHRHFSPGLRLACLFSRLPGELLNCSHIVSLLCLEFAPCPLFMGETPRSQPINHSGPTHLPFALDQPVNNPPLTLPPGCHPPLPLLLPFTSAAAPLTPPLCSY